MSVADVSPAVTVASEPTVRPTTSVFRAKLPAVTPLSNVVSVSVTVSSAPFRVASVRAAGLLVSAAVGSTTVMVKVSIPRSLSSVLASPSAAYMVTVCAPVVFVVGVPQTCRAKQFGAPKSRPAGRPLAV